VRLPWASQKQKQEGKKSAEDWSLFTKESDLSQKERSGEDFGIEGNSPESFSSSSLPVKNSEMRPNGQKKSGRFLKEWLESGRSPTKSSRLGVFLCVSLI
jgi:hypothetical protein